MATAKKPPLITHLPLTAEAREKFLVETFRDELPHVGELFVPGNSFYVRSGSPVTARHMIDKLCEWLGIKPGYIGLEFESHPDAGSPGHRHTIFIETRVMHNDMLLGATLAHALTRYLLEERKQIYVSDAFERLSIVATGTVVFGLGIVMLNGLQPGRANASFHREILGNVPVSEYGAMLHGFLWQHAIPEHAYSNNLAPWTSKLLGIAPGKRPITAVRQSIHKQRQKKYQTIGLWWMGTIAVFICGLMAVQAVGLDNKHARSLRETVRLYDQLVVACNNSLAYTKQYSDLSDIQTMRAVNAEQARCNSLENRRQSVQNAYDKAL